MCHPGHKDGVSSSRRRAAGNINPVPISGGHIPDPQEEDNQYSNKSRLGFLSTTLLFVITRHLVAALLGMAEFSLGDHDLLMGTDREEIHWQHTEAALGEARATTSTKDARRMERIQRTGACLSVLFSTFNGEDLLAQEWRYPLFLRYGINPSDLPDNFDGRVAVLFICHTLDFHKGGLITVRHNELRHGVADLASKDFTPMHVRENLKNFTDRAVHGRKAKEKAKGVP